MARRLSISICVLVLAAVAPAAHAAGPEATARAVAKQMRSAGASSGALVVDLTTGRTLYESRADAPRVPASVNKLFTTATALLRFGPEATLQTTVSAAAAPDALGLLTGDLYLRGGGDPTLSSAELRQLAGDLVAITGLVELDGRVIGDESLFDSLRGGPASRFRTSQYVGPLSALIVDQGRTLKRRPYFQSRPALHAAQIFHDELKALGVKVRKAPRAGVQPEGATLLATHTSPAMSEIARFANEPSDNHVAETLLKSLGATFGASGSLASGAEVAAETLGPLGLRPRMIDGSGLARGNRTTPRQVVTLLDAMSDRGEYLPFRDSLAIAGRTGTLKDRMRAGAARDRCRAKTGTLIGVVALAGYCETRGGELVAFAFLLNRVSTWGGRALTDRATGAIARYDAEG